MKDSRATHLNKVSKERRAFIEEVSLADARMKTARKEYPEGSIWLWTLGAMYGPKGSADMNAIGEQEAAE